MPTYAVSTDENLRLKQYMLRWNQHQCVIQLENSKYPFVRQLVAGLKGLGYVDPGEILDALSTIDTVCQELFADPPGKGNDPQGIFPDQY